MKLVALHALAALLGFGPSSPEPVGDQLPVDLMEQTTAHPFWTLAPDRVAMFDRLAGCESGGNWAIETGNGYSGGIQFSLSSWRAVGGTGRPSGAPREEQIWRGHLLQQEGGWAHWPGCARKFGWIG